MTRTEILQIIRTPDGRFKYGLIADISTEANAEDHTVKNVLLGRNVRIPVKDKVKIIEVAERIAMQELKLSKL